MAEVQTTYGEDIAAGFPGMVANGETSNRISRTIEDAAGIDFGVPAFRGVGDRGCVLLPTAGALLGIVISHAALGLLAGQTADKYAQYENVPIMTQGVIFVTALDAVTDGLQAYATPAGAISGVAAGNVILPDWFFDTTGGAGALVKLAKR